MLMLRCLQGCSVETVAADGIAEFGGILLWKLLQLILMMLLVVGLVRGKRRGRCS